MAEEDVYWKLVYDVNMPRNGKVHVHGAQWDPDQQVLFLYVSTSKQERNLKEYREGIPLYEENEEGIDELIGMKPIELGAPAQSLVKGRHHDLAQLHLNEEE